MKALVLLLPLVAAKSGPVLLREAGTDGMSTNMFEGMNRAVEAAQKLSVANAVKRDALPMGDGSLLNPIRADVLLDSSKTTLMVVKRQNPMTTTVTKQVTEKAEASSQAALVTQTVLETVREVLETIREAKPTKNPEANNNNGGKKKGGENQAAKETVTTTVTAAGAQETGNNNNNNGNNNNNNNNNNNPEASATSQNAEATQSSNAEQSANNNNNNNNEQASRTGSEPNVPMSTGTSGKGGVIVPLSAVVPQGDVATSEIMGTNFAVSGFIFKNRRRSRQVRRAGTRWYDQ